MNGLRKFLNTSAGKVVGVMVAIAAVALMAYVVRDSLGANEGEATSRNRLFICEQTGKTFDYELKLGDVMPVLSPHTGQKTGYPVELCYWTVDGKPKDEPTPVLLLEETGKPGPTFCPDCKRLVVGHNPRAAADRPAPPTQQEYLKRKDARNAR